jgi:hypothetical protein
VLGLDAGQRLGESVRNHVVCWTINQLNRALRDDVADEVVACTNVLRPRMVLVLFGKSNSRLIVGKQCGGL